MSDYLDIVYNRKNKPLTTYPEKLVNYIMYNIGISVGAGLSLIEPGVGCGDHLRLFKDKGFDVCGLDVSPRSAEISPDLTIDIIDADGFEWPYEDESFDVVYSKSFIEHLLQPEQYLQEAYRILKPGGIVVTLTPDWVANHKKFYDDYTHVKPFTKVSLANIKKSVGFVDVDAFLFRQLPSTWKSPLFNRFCTMVACFVPYDTKMPFLRWSRELMLFGVGTKPTD